MDWIDEWVPPFLVYTVFGLGSQVQTWQQVMPHRMDGEVLATSGLRIGVQLLGIVMGGEEDAYTIIGERRALQMLQCSW